MSTIPAPTPKRHALGLPPGSVRATHTLIIVGLFCATLLVPTPTTMGIPPYLVYLLFLALGHYFAHRSAAPSEAGAQPLYLPRGAVRLLIVVALAGTIGWCLYNDAGKLEKQFELSLDALKAQPILPLAILGAFFLGVIVRMLLGSDRSLFAQDLQAWLSIISALGLCVAGIIHLVVIPSLVENIPWGTWEMILASVVAFYFGERS